MQTRAQLKEAAKEQLIGKWTDAVVLVLVYSLLSWFFASLGKKLDIFYITNIAFFIFTGSFIYAISRYFLNLVRGEKVGWRMLFDGFKTMMMPAIELYLWKTLKVFLWSLLLIVPGIIKTYAYSQAFFLINDDKKLNPKVALAKSEKMMDGHKWELFMLHLSFIGWAFLCILTFGIGFLWLRVYIWTTLSNYYENLVKETNELKATTV